MRVHELSIDDEKLAGFCRSAGIRELMLFGSATRDDFTPHSDVDVIVRFAGEDRRDLFDLGGLQQELTDLFGRQVHLHTPDMIHPYLRNRIRTSARPVYTA